jgi:outer membrane protein TolC
MLRFPILRHLVCPSLLFVALLAQGAPPVASPGRVGGGPLTLEQAYDRALATDQSIQIAYWEIRKSNLLPWSALAKLGPQISASGSYEKTSLHTLATVRSVSSVIVNGVATPVTSFNDVTTTARDGTAFSSINYTQPLIDFTVFPAYRLGNLTKVATRLAQQYTIRETLFGLASAFYEVLKQQRLVEVDKETLRLTTEQYDLAQKRANVGEVTRADVLRAQVTVETARQTLVQDEGTLDLDRNTLGNILNFSPDTPFSVVEPPDYPTGLPEFSQLLGRAYEHREDLRAKKIAIDQDIARRGEIIGEYGPKVVAQVDGDRGHISGVGADSTYQWDALVSVQVPIFTGGQREIDLKTAGEQIRETRLAYEQGMKSVEADVKQAWLAVRTLQQTLKAAHAQVVAAEQGYHDLENQYRAGTATSVDVLTALNDLNTARKDLALQTYGYQVALRDLEEVSGVFQEERVRRSKIR